MNKGQFKEGHIPPNRKEISYYVTEDNCHICTSHPLRGGYPVISRNNKRQSISRYLYTLSYGVIPDGLVIRHKCDNPLCINIEHLELGTQRDNIQDCIIRKRRVGNCKLTNEQIEEIRLDLRPSSIITKEYNINRTRVWQIRKTGGSNGR